MIYVHVEVEKNIRNAVVNRKRKQNLKWIWWGAIISLPVIFLLYSYFVEPMQVEVKDYQINSTQIPKEFIGKRIVFFSDIHYGVKNIGLDKLVEKVNSENPDIIIIGGDFADRDPNKVVECFQKLAKLRSKDGIYVTFGNHDRWVFTRPKIIAELEKEKIISFSDNADISQFKMRSVENKSFWLSHGDARIKIGGVGDLYYRDQNLESTISDTQKSDFVMLVSHNPDYFENLDSDRIDLMFAGHLHGGQVGIFGWYPIIPSEYGAKYRFGKFEKRGTEMIVSKGIGGSYFPFRFGARPDIVVINLK